MGNGIRITCPCGLINRISSKFCVDSRGQHETHEEVQKTHRPKRFENNNEDENKIQNTLSDKNYQASSQLMTQ